MEWIELLNEDKEIRAGSVFMDSYGVYVLTEIGMIEPTYVTWSALCVASEGHPSGAFVGQRYFLSFHRGSFAPVWQDVTVIYEA